ncbi:MAG: LysR family transcriptional regulator [Kofleriaceae bacterium]|nr:LysR family transcriptional regulator [Kofleriaceae bacterium]MCB9573126.1 LysR family transcriptional regulator [Kofleriaceae bacterium]
MAGVDLNLLVVLDALLTERHVTRAAARIGLSQSAASHALARLRALFDDPLLVRGAGGGLMPTARAEAIAPALRRALDGLADTLRGPAVFDPATAERELRIATADFSDLLVMPALAARLEIAAPRLTLWSVAVPDDVPRALAAGDIDLVLTVRGRLRTAGLFERPLFDERFVCVVRDGHPAARQRLTLARYLALSHLLIAPGGRRGGIVDELLTAMGKQRRVAAAVPHFLVAPHVVAATDLILTLPARIAETLAGPLGLTVLPPPFEIPGFAMAMVWHERAHHDDGHRWLRDQVALVAGDAASPGTPRRGARRAGPVRERRDRAADLP